MTWLVAIFLITPTMASPQVKPEMVIKHRCRCYYSAEIYVKELMGEIAACEFQLAMGKVDTSSRLAQAKELLPLAEVAKEELRLARILELKEKVERLEREIHGHIREIESRVVMSKKEELAREATVEWLQEDVDKLEDKIHALEHSVADPDCITCIAMRKDAARHEAYRVAREADGVTDDDSDY